MQWLVVDWLFFGQGKYGIGFDFYHTFFTAILIYYHMVSRVVLILSKSEPEMLSGRVSAANET